MKRLVLKCALVSFSFRIMESLKSTWAMIDAIDCIEKLKATTPNDAGSSSLDKMKRVMMRIASVKNALLSTEIRSLVE